ncbi:M20/M25/M40 family metallo-hydrolase [Virgibacillus kimchii]
MEWQTKKELTDLLCSLVQYPSITGSEAEIAIAEYVHTLLEQKPYFKSNPDHLQLHPLEDGRRLVTALVKSTSETKETVILLSHFDVVGVDDYGSLKNLSFQPRELTEELKNRKKQLPQSVQYDLENGDWLFGRGTMDMKAGLALQLSMLEKAMDGQFNGNVLLLSVPDEEVNSKGMLEALPAIDLIKKEEGLTFKACLNSEPSFSKYPGDPNHYIYTGSVGKILPGFYCYGKESHVGEPFSGINPNLMISFLSQEIELNDSFIEKAEEEVTPPPVSLMQRDLKDEYSVQTPQAAVAMFNVLYLKQTFETLNAKLLRCAEEAAKKVDVYVQNKAAGFRKAVSDFSIPVSNVSVIMYEDLYAEAVKQYGEAEIKRRQNLLVSQRNKGDRDFSTLLVQDLAALCKEMAPMIVLFYSPPFYPAVSSFHDPYIRNIIGHIQHYAKTNYDISFTEAAFFTGLSDLSFIGSPSSENKLGKLTDNLPLQNNGFVFPSDVMERLTMPVLNIGPLGKDPHQWTERLEITYSFDYLPRILTEAIHQLLDNQYAA